MQGIIPFLLWSELVELAGVNHDLNEQFREFRHLARPCLFRLNTNGTMSVTTPSDAIETTDFHVHRIQLRTLRYDGGKGILERALVNRIFRDYYPPGGLDIRKPLFNIAMSSQRGQRDHRITLPNREGPNYRRDYDFFASNLKAVQDRELEHERLRQEQAAEQRRLREEEAALARIAAKRIFHVKPGSLAVTNPWKVKP